MSNAQCRSSRLLSTTARVVATDQCFPQFSDEIESVATRQQPASGWREAPKIYKL